MTEASRVARTQIALSEQLLQCALRGRLLGRLLASPGAGADLVSGHRGPDLEAAVVRRAPLPCPPLADGLTRAPPARPPLGPVIRGAPRGPVGPRAGTRGHPPRGPARTR